jgi:glycosyltransferase involved in cell wall biosynthesis
VSEKFNFNDDKRECVFCEVPHGELIDYQSMYDLSKESKEYSDKIFNFLCTDINGKYDLVITHDWVFTGWNLPFALALQGLDVNKKTKYLHWIHSMPVGFKSWWFISRYSKNHSLVYPNKTDSINIMEQYRMFSAKNFEIIPHIKDLRTWFDFCVESKEIIKQYPRIMSGDFVKVYPVGTDRLSYKRVNIAISIMASLKKRFGRTVCLCIANTNGSGRGKDERLEPYYKMAQDEGLNSDEFFFTSELNIKNKPRKFAQGLDQRTLRELFLCSNLLIYPTIQESFGLIGLEAPLSGGKIMVLNRSLNMMSEVHRNIGLYFNFGSFDQDLNVINQEEYCTGIASAITREFYNNSGVLSPTWIRQAYNYDRLYKDYYMPIIYNK